MLKFVLPLRPEPSLSDSKTTVMNLISMQFMDDDTVYEFPQNYKDLDHHVVLMALPVAKAAARDLKPRCQKKKVF